MPVPTEQEKPEPAEIAAPAESAPAPEAKPAAAKPARKPRPPRKKTETKTPAPEAASASDSPESEPAPAASESPSPESAESPKPSRPPRSRSRAASSATAPSVPSPPTAFYGTGRRKSAKSRVFIRPGGSGKFIVNGRQVDDFFTRISSRIIARQALVVAGSEGKFDLYVTVRGGGENGQAEAVRHGVARALVAGDPDCKPELRRAGLVSRDPRAVERKKVGLRKARRAKQYSKR